MSSNKVILIIDDEFIILESLKIQMNNVLEHDVMLEAASSAEEAFALIDEFHEKNMDLVLVISDYHLDEIKGTDVLHYSSKKFPAAHKAILSGRSESEMIPELKKEFERIEFIAKPWDFEDIKNAVRLALHNR